jgi:hypothetical protein
LAQIDIACIVEGHGERDAVRLLLQRIAAEIAPDTYLGIPRPIRVSRSAVVKAGELERAVELAVRRIGGSGAVFVLLDSDDDCPAKLGPELLHRGVAARPDIPIAVVLAKREMESWFLSAPESLRGCRDLSPVLPLGRDPESISDAKGMLSSWMPLGRSYSPATDQAALTAVFDIEQARQADSFDKCYREVARILEVLGYTA